METIGSVLQPCPRTDTTKPRGGLPQTTPEGHTGPEQSATYPFIIPAWAMFSFQLQNGHVLKWWWQEAGKYTDRSMVSKHIPRRGESQPRVVPASPPPALSTGNLGLRTEKVRGSMLPFSTFFFFLILSFRSWWESAGWANKLTANTQQEDRTARATRPPARHFLPGAQPSTTPLINWGPREGLPEVHRSVPRVILLTGPARLTELLEPPGWGY